MPIARAAVNDDCSSINCGGANEVCVLNLCTCNYGYHDSDNDLNCSPCANGYFKATPGTEACGQAVPGRYACLTNDDDGTGVNSAGTDQCACPQG